jgi:hypothetical protein
MSASLIPREPIEAIRRRCLERWLREVTVLEQLKAVNLSHGDGEGRRVQYLAYLSHGVWLRDHLREVLEDLGGLMGEW